MLILAQKMPLNCDNIRDDGAETLNEGNRRLSRTELGTPDTSESELQQFGDFSPLQKVLFGGAGKDCPKSPRTGLANRLGSGGPHVARRIAANSDTFACHSHQVGLLSRYRQCALGPRSSTSSG